MNLIQKLKIFQVNRALKKNIESEKLIFECSEDIKHFFIKPFEETYDEKNLKKIIKEDLLIMQELKSKNEDLYKKAKILLKLIQDISDVSTYGVAKQYAEGLMVRIESFENLMLQDESEILSEFNALLDKFDLCDEDISSFIKKHSYFFKIKTNKKLKKNIEKILKYHMVTDVLEQPGPIIKNNEIDQLKNRLNQYFNSGYFLDFIKEYNLEKIYVNVSIYGSLVTGFASVHSKYSQLPSDYMRVSDVDLGLVIDLNSTKIISLDGRCLFKQGVYYGPFFKETAANLGPFIKMFDFVENVSVAGKNRCCAR